MDGRGDGGRDVRGMTGEQLKAAIFTQLFSGKLTKQLRSDGTAETLLKQIEKKNPNHKKASRIIRKEDGNYYEVIGNRETCITDELLFEIPNSWAWVHLNEIAVSGLGKTLNKSKDTGETKKYLCSINVYWDGIRLDEVKEARFTPIDIDKYRLQKGDLLICEGGDAGRTAIWEYEDEMYYQNALHRVRFFGGINPRYFRSLLEFYKINGTIDSYCKGMTIKHLVQGSLNAMRFPLPPLAEQERIVARIEELVPLVQQYTAKSEKLNALNASFPEMMKKSILQEAVKGRLVPQDPNDEPASVLLKKIAEEKKRLIQEGKVKKEKEIDPPQNDEIPYDIPKSWAWVRLGHVTYNRDSERIPLSVSERAKLKKVYDYYGASGIIDKVEKYLFEKPLLLIGEDGANLLNRSTPIAYIAKGKYWVNNHAHVLDMSPLLDMSYIANYINSISLAKYVTGTAQPKMNQAKMNSIWIPIPPLAEQKRIVTKLDELMPFCETLVHKRVTTKIS